MMGLEVLKEERIRGRGRIFSKVGLQKECERENESEAERNEERASKAKQAESGEGSVADGALGHSVVCRVFRTRKTEQNRTEQVREVPQVQ
jgi:hypothetical protein